MLKDTELLDILSINCTQVATSQGYRVINAQQAEKKYNTKKKSNTNLTVTDTHNCTV